MSVQGPFKVQFHEMFPHGAFAMGVQPLVDFDASTREHKVQARDKETGIFVYVVDVVDADPEARERTFKVKVVADVEPQLPEPIPGTPLHPVALEGLTVTPYLKDVGNGRQRIAYSLRASGLTAPRRQTNDAGKAA